MCNMGKKNMFGLRPMSYFHPHGLIYEFQMNGPNKVILVSELSLAENSSQDEIEKLVDNKIEMSYKEYRVPTEAKIDLQQNAVNKFIPFNGDTNTTNT